jgi:hypothetical protein
MSFERAGCLPWSLRPGEARGTQKARSVAGVPRTARKKRPATPVGMTEAEKREENRRKPVLLEVRFG